MHGSLTLPAVHPVAAVQSEDSLWTRDVEHNGMLATCADLGQGFVPFSPLGAANVDDGASITVQGARLPEQVLKLTDG